MTLVKRIIPCLDVSGGRVVKGVNFVNLVDAGDPVELAKRYDQEGADELTFLDISASVEDRKTTIDIVRRTAEQVFIPLTVGGGIRSADDVNVLLRNGNQVLVLSVDARRGRTSSGFEVTTHGGRQGTDIDALAWVEAAISRGVGEILLNSMDADGTRAGYDLEMIAAVRKISSVPIIASGGAGSISDFAQALGAGADALLAASVFHFGVHRIADVKGYLAQQGYPVRR